LRARHGSDSGDDPDRLGDAVAEGQERAEEAWAGVWLAEEAGSIVGICAGEGHGELRQVGNVDTEGRGEGKAAVAGWGAEGVEGAAVEVDVEEGLVRAAAVEDGVVVVAHGLAGVKWDASRWSSVIRPTGARARRDGG
jgi:hypothetical protein